MGRILVGCAGWSYDDWEGLLYPSGMEPGQRLGRYAERFGFVEVDSTFYGVPSRAAVESWVQRVATNQEFALAAKAPRAATHEAFPQRNAKQIDRVLDVFSTHVVEPLEQAKRLAALLVQLPPSVRYESPADADALARLIAPLRPERRRVAVEFRHTSWFARPGVLGRHASEVLQRMHAAAAAIDGYAMTPHPPAPDSWSYLRLHGPDVGGAGYSAEALDGWAQWIEASAAGGQDVHVVLNNHVRGRSPRDAAGLLERLGLPAPDLPDVPRQGSLDSFGPR